ncbi:hypothetical protein [Paraburkholderia sp. PGU19]|uniref:hypothetical protein n=1 Tax=Paraburkholderia sp. PGU19 TaxID=2735434 RepID=UPI0015DA5BBF|nr:hypothetical protein [Paraburkholderia sp. PGU19]
MTKEFSVEMLNSETLQPAHARVLRKWLLDMRRNADLSLDNVRSFLRDFNSWAIAAADE